MAPTLRTKPDAVAVAAVETARSVLLEEVAAADVGEHLGHVVEGDRVVTHHFACTRRGYAGWHWSVTVARAARQKTVTVDEIVLVPGDRAIVAPEWVPYKERVKSGDLSPGDLHPVEEGDPRLVPTYSFGDDPLDADEKEQVRQVARDLAAERWYDGDGGPAAPLAQSAPDVCSTCGFLLRLAGPLSETFGVCANGNANDDGRVVSFDHGCGAHSEVQLAKRHEPQPLPEHVYDTLASDELETL